VLQKVYDLQLIEVLIVYEFRSMLEFQVTGDGAWFLHARFAGSVEKGQANLDGGAGEDHEG
jgi:hypothetical protein